MFDYEKIMEPHRMTYTTLDLNVNHFLRTDFQIRNKEKQILQCSIYKCQKYTKSCILYLHSYNACRLEATDYVYFLQNIDLCCFDFQGAGQSGGKYVTFGIKEQHDVEVVIEYLKNRYERIIIWGRSMGATTALKYCLNAQNIKNIKGLILDSPFCNLDDVGVNLVNQKIWIPKCIISGLFGYFKTQIEREYSLTFNSINFPQTLNIDIPMIMICNPFDKTVPFTQSQQIFNSYKGIKHMIRIEQQHHEQRDCFIIHQVMQFIRSLTPSIKLSPTKRPQLLLGDEDRMSDGMLIKQKIMNRTSSVRKSGHLNSALIQKQRGLMQLY